MGGMWGSRERIEERLSALEVVYGSFPVDQTTISIPEPRFERLLGGGVTRLVEARVEVHNEDDDVLHLQHNRGQTLPCTGVGFDEKIEKRARTAVREQTGIECAVEDLARATIAGVRNAGNPDAGTLYFLVVVLRARKKGGTVDDCVEWRSGKRTARPLRAL